MDVDAHDGWRTARLAIEPLAHRHAEALIAALRHDEVDRYLAAPDVTTAAALHQRIDRLARGPDDAGERWFNAALRRLDDGVVIGRLEASIVDGWAEVAYLIGPPHQRRGFAREAVGWLLAHLRGQRVADVWATVHPANLPSIALLAALGFTAAPAPPARPLGSYDPGDRVFVSRP